MKQKKLTIVPVELKQANEFVKHYHRHHKPAVGHRFSLGCVCDGVLCGIAIVGRPVARMVNQRNTLEVTRCCTDGTPNACSCLYGAAARVGMHMGYAKIQTYILDVEKGTSLKAAGWFCEGERGGGNWNGIQRTGRRTDQPMNKKQLYSKNLNPAVEFNMPELVSESVPEGGLFA